MQSFLAMKHCWIEPHWGSLIGRLVLQLIACWSFFSIAIKYAMRKVVWNIVASVNCFLVLFSIAIKYAPWITTDTLIQQCIVNYLDYSSSVNVKLFYELNLNIESYYFSAVKFCHCIKLIQLNVINHLLWICLNVQTDSFRDYPETVSLNI